MTNPFISATHTKAMAIGLFALCGLTLASLAQNAQRVLLKDKDSSVVITNYTDFVVKRLSAKSTRVVANGTPLIVTWSRDGMVMKAASFDGTVATPEKGKLELETAALTKGVEVEVTRGTDLKRKLELNAGSARYVAADLSLTLQSGLHLVSTDSKGLQKVDVKGSAGKFTLYANPAPKTARSIVKSGSISGGVTFVMTSKAADGSSGTITATCQTVTMDDAEGKVTLQGNVDITGDDPILVGDIKANRVEILLDAQGTPDEIRVFGTPASTAVGKKSTPPGGGNR